MNKKKCFINIEHDRKIKKNFFIKNWDFGFQNSLARPAFDDKEDVELFFRLRKFMLERDLQSEYLNDFS